MNHSLGKTLVSMLVFSQAKCCLFTRSAITQGRIDGSGGRGSFAGLEDTLQAIVRSIRCQLEPFLAIGESVISATEILPLRTVKSVKQANACDLVMLIWENIANTLSDRFPSMFSIGIPNTFSYCYRAVDAFHSAVWKIAGGKWEEQVSQRLQKSIAFQQFQSRWKLDMYYQLRCREIFYRIDRCCEIASREGLTTSFKAYESLYRAESASHSVSPSLSTEEYEVVRREVSTNNAQGYQLSIISVFMLEMLTCLHHSVGLTPLTGKFFALVLRLILRLEAQIAIICNTDTPSFAGKDSLERLRAAVEYQESQSALTSSSSTTPAKVSASTRNDSPMPSKRSGTMQTPQSTVIPVTPTTAGSVGPTPMKDSIASASSSSVDELVLLVHDLFRLDQRVSLEVSQRAKNKVLWKDETMTNDARSPIDMCLSFQLRQLGGARLKVCERVSSLLCNDCRRAVTAIKAIAGKYRMTNKPAPETSSSYVETVLQPLK